MNDDERTCPECGETIKKAAGKCRFCGHRFRSADPIDGPMTESQKKVAKTSKVGCAVIAIAFIAMLSFCKPDENAGSGGSASTTVASEEDEDTPPDQATQMRIVVASQDGVRSRLKDPESADFRNVGYYSGGSEGASAVCGEVNAKNSFGGFTGFERFVALGEDIAFLESDVEASEFAKVWKSVCVKADTDEVQIP
uniref:zinc ribbon domain-containing protein n=1 Tax=uncultured Erythrobacter sp. TaxID=263913 RepID=UPI00261352A4|nr:zinc ribbon domain-containing protein [uncultured Erythrobacter sp.]